MIYILIMQLRGASFILRMKSRVLLRSEVGMIMVSICLPRLFTWHNFLIPRPAAVGDLVQQKLS